MAGLKQRMVSSFGQGECGLQEARWGRLLRRIRFRLHKLVESTEEARLLGDSYPC